MSAKDDHELVTQEVGPVGAGMGSGKGSSFTKWLYRPWTQLLLISVVCFCDPGMYNCEFLYPFGVHTMF
jgi:hypothetical protein